MKTSLGLRLGQSLTMTPALQQAIKLLQLSSLDLQQEIQQVLESNVMLELDGDAPAELEPGAEAAEAQESAPSVEVASVEVSSDVDIPQEMPVDADWGDVYDSAGTGSATGKSGEDDDLQDYLQANLHGQTSLRDHLNWQAGLAPFTPTESEIAAHLIDAINDDGYLENWEDIAQRLQEALDVSYEQVDTVLKTVQEFDPNGVAARDLAECLRLQLLQFPAREPGIQAALTLVDHHIGLLARKDPALIAKGQRPAAGPGRAGPGADPVAAAAPGTPVPGARVGLRGAGRVRDQEGGALEGLAEPRARPPAADQWVLPIHDSPRGQFPRPADPEVPFAGSPLFHQ